MSLPTNFQTAEGQKYYELIRTLQVTSIHHYTEPAIHGSWMTEQDVSRHNTSLAVSCELSQVNYIYAWILASDQDNAPHKMMDGITTDWQGNILTR